MRHNVALVSDAARAVYVHVAGSSYKLQSYINLHNLAIHITFISILGFRHRFPYAQDAVSNDRLRHLQESMRDCNGSVRPWVWRWFLREAFEASI